MTHQNLIIKIFIIGPMENNSYLIADPDTRNAAIIDPSFDSESIIEEANRLDWLIKQIWLTHAHFDHIAGIPTILAGLDTKPAIYVHANDLPLYHSNGGADDFGIPLGKLPEPDGFIQHNQNISIGNSQVTVLHTPGHTPGHVAFYDSIDSVVFTGDLIFHRGIGRTDLPGGDYSMLISSIKNHILTLPPKTQLLSGHGINSTVGDEENGNPFL